MIILDTNVLSALMQQAPDKRVVTWLDNQPVTSIWTTSITVFEVRFGLLIMALGKRCSLLIEAFGRVLEKIDHRVISFDVAAAERTSDLMASRRAKGRACELRDTMIAGIALAHHATLATRNTAHFDDTAVPLVNPWSD